MYFYVFLLYLMFYVLCAYLIILHLSDSYSVNCILLCIHLSSKVENTPASNHYTTIAHDKIPPFCNKLSEIICKIAFTLLICFEKLGPFHPEGKLCITQI